MLQKLKIRTRMLVLILGINLVVLISIFIIYFSNTKQIVVRETQEKAMEKLSSVVISLEGYLDSKTQIVWTFCRNPDIVRWLETNTVRDVVRADDPLFDRNTSYLNQLVEDDGFIRSVFLASEKTQNYYDNQARLSPVDYIVETREWYSKTRELGRPTYDVSVDVLDGTVNANYREPIYTADGQFVGVGGMDIALGSFSGYMSELDNVFETGYAFLVGEDGLILVHPDTSLVLKKKLSDFQDEPGVYRNVATVAQRIGDGAQGLDEVIFDGEERILMYAPMQDLGWTLVLSVAASEINGPLKTLASMSVMIGLVAFLLLILAIVFITGSISKPINRLVGMLKDIAQGEGDLTKRVQIDSQDELGDLAHWFNLFVDKIHNIITQVRKNTDEVASATSNISSTTNQLATAAEEQSVQTSEVATSVRQVASAISTNSQNARETSRIAEQASQKANNGKDVMLTAQKGMEDIVVSAAKTREIISGLFERVDQIGDIVWAINDIANQTKVLALNATIEAAAAGDRGRGFAVVADEVRHLVQKTSQATEEISKTINAIQVEAKDASQAIDEVNVVVEKGKQATTETEAVLSEIVETVSQAMAMVQQIASVSNEQSTGAEEISKSVAAISSVTQQTSSGAEQLATAAECLNRQTESLHGLLSQFIIGNTADGTQNA